MGKGRRFTGSRSRREEIKIAQLCAAVRETISLALAESSDERLFSLFVVGVVPAPDASRLEVRLEMPVDLDEGEVRSALDQHAGRLRSEVASSIQRKKTPTLVFALRPSGLDA